VGSISIHPSKCALLSFGHRGGIHLLPAWIFGKGIAAEGSKSLLSFDVSKLIPSAICLLEPIENRILVLGEFHLSISQKRDSFRKHREGQFSKKRFPSSKQPISKLGLESCLRRKRDSFRKQREAQLSKNIPRSRERISEPGKSISFKRRFFQEATGNAMHSRKKTISRFKADNL
jgi:hypothetical protein